MTSDERLVDPARRRVTSIAHGPTTIEFPPAASFGPRTLRDFEFVWVLRGAATCTIDTPGRHRRTVELTPGRLLLSQPGMTDEYHWTPSAVSQHAYVHFSLAENVPTATRYGWPLVRTLTAEDPMAAICRYLSWLPGSNDSAASATTTVSIEFLLRLFVVGPLPTNESGSSQHLHDLAEWLTARWRAQGVGPVPVGEIGTGVSLSTGHLSRICRTEFGVGPAEVVELLRLARAAVLLRRSNLSVGAVANACGFVDAFHFSRRFRRAYGLPPREFRAATERGDEPRDPLAENGLLAFANHVIADQPLPG